MFPLASLAVMVNVCEPPAVWEPEPDKTNLVAAPELITTTSLPVYPPVVEVNVKVPEPVTPVYFIPKAVKSATPPTKSPAWLSTLLVPEPKPLITPPSEFVTVTAFVPAL
ncbi:hypothetical protein AQEC111735_12125 [Aquirufa ecclesiirivi]